MDGSEYLDWFFASVYDFFNNIWENTCETAEGLSISHWFVVLGILVILVTTILVSSKLKKSC